MCLEFSGTLKEARNQTRLELASLHGAVVVVVGALVAAKIPFD